jgi:hypothetical protein
VKYADAKRLIEAQALALRGAQPGLHPDDACAEALRANPSLWLLYQQGIRAGMAPTFVRQKRRHVIPTPRERAWQVIENLARTLVASSETPVTLRQAVMRVVEAQPDLYRAYATAPKR